MPDDLRNRGAQDRARINLNEPHEVKCWTQKWFITEEELRRAVARAGTGTGTAAVGALLGKSDR